MRTLEIYTLEECRLVIHGLEDEDIAVLVQLLGLVNIGGKLWIRKLVDEAYNAIPTISVRTLAEICELEGANGKRVVVALGALRNRCQYWKEKAEAYARKQASGAA